MIIDCDGCQMRDLACDDCVVTFLLGPPGGLGSAEQSALAVLAEGAQAGTVTSVEPAGGSGAMVRIRWDAREADLIAAGGFVLERR